MRDILEVLNETHSEIERLKKLLAQKEGDAATLEKACILLGGTGVKKRTVKEERHAEQVEGVERVQRMKSASTKKTPTSIEDTPPDYHDVTRPWDK